MDDREKYILGQFETKQFEDLSDLFKRRGTNFGLSPLDVSGNTGVANIPLPGAYGVTYSRAPGKILLDRSTQSYPEDTVREVLAHEIEHNRQHQARGSISKFNQWRTYPDGLMIRASMDDKDGTLEQGTPDELLAFIRGKEARHGTEEYKNKVTKGLTPEAVRWLDANIFAGKPRFLATLPQDEIKPRPEPSLLDLFRRKMRSFTSY